MALIGLTFKIEADLQRLASFRAHPAGRAVGRAYGASFREVL